MQPKKRIVAMLAGLMMAAGALAAQDAAQPTPFTPAATRELVSILALGDAVFEPGTWLAGGQEYPDRTVVSWLADEFGGISLAEYLHFDEGLDTAAINDLFNTDWFAAAFTDYDTWTQTGACTNGSTTLYEFTLVLMGVNYDVRYWIEPLPPTRVLTMQVLFPQDQAALLDTYSARYRPAFSACP
jgi:hypothetical protein